MQSTAAPTPTERDRLLAEARVLGLGGDNTPTLAAVDRRRAQVLALALVSLVGIAAILAVDSPATSTLLPAATPVRPMMLALGFGIVVYVADRERRLRRLTRLLVDERALSAALMQRLDEVRMHLDVAKAMNSSAGLDAVLTTIVAASTSILGGYGGALLLLDGDVLHVMASAGSAPAPGQQLPLAGTPNEYVTRNWEMFIVPAHDDHPGAMHVPVRHGAELLGVLVLYGQPGRPFGDYDTRAAELFAEQAACAINQTHRAHAAKWEQAERAKLDEERGRSADQTAAALKNPLASLRAATKMLQREKLVDQERRDLAAVIDRQADKLSRAIEDILH